MKYKDFKEMSQNEMKRIKGGSESGCNIYCCIYSNPQNHADCFTWIVGPVDNCDSTNTQFLMHGCDLFFTGSPQPYCAGTCGS